MVLKLLAIKSYPNTERFRKEVSAEFNLALSPSVRLIFLLDKFELFNFSHPDPSLIDDSHVNNAFLEQLTRKN